MRGGFPSSLCPIFFLLTTARREGFVPRSDQLNSADACYDRGSAFRILCLFADDGAP